MPEFYHAKSAVISTNDQPRVFLATPCIHIYANHFAAVVKALPRLMGAGIAIDHFLFANGAHVDDARNACVAAFLKSDCDMLVFVDADVGFPPEALYRLVTHAHADIVAGVYPRKEMQRSYPFRFEGDELATGEDGLIRENILSVPAGFLRLSRKLIEHMVEANIAQSFRSPETGEATPCLFARATKNGERRSGDVAFCEAARALGYVICVDPMLELSHAGEVRFQGMLAADFAASPPDAPMSNKEAASAGKRLAALERDAAAMKDTIKYYEDQTKASDRELKALREALALSQDPIKQAG